MKSKIVLGKTYKDVITGFTGVATGHCVYITGCNQVLLTPKCKEDGTSPDSRWVDEQRCEDVGVKAVVLDNSKTPGFDKPAPVR